MNCNRDVMAGFGAAHGQAGWLGKSRTTSWPFGSFGFGWFGILLLRLNLLNNVAARGAGKGFRRLVGHVVRGQGECPVLNLEDGEDHFADGIFRWWPTIFDGGVELPWVCVCREYKCRLMPVRAGTIVERIARDGDGAFASRPVAFPIALETS
jgi:hypothetical protein